MFLGTLFNVLMKKKTEIKVILEMCLLKFKKVQKIQGVPLSMNNTGGQTPKFVENNAEKLVFHNFDPFKFAGDA